MSKQRYAKISLRLPRGKLINGSLTSLVTTDHMKQPIPPEKHHVWFAIAIPKNAPGMSEILGTIHKHVWTTFAGLAGNQYVMEQLKLPIGSPTTTFAWKIDDGDTDPRTSKWEGAAGCWVFHLKTNVKALPVNTYDGSNVQLDPARFVLGNEVDAFISVEINGQMSTQAGCYINPVVVRWLDHGKRINKGADAATLFGDTVGRGYYAPEGGAMPSEAAYVNHNHGGVAAQQQAGQYVPPPPPGAAPPPPPPPPAPAPESDEQWNIRHTGHAAPGYRWNPETRAWGPPSVATSNAASSSGQYGGTAYNAGNGAASGQGVPAYGQQQQAAGSVGVGGQPPAGQYPGTQYGPGNPPPGVQQQNYAGGPPSY